MGAYAKVHFCMTVGVCFAFGHWLLFDNVQSIE